MRVAGISYATSQGLSHLMRSAFEAGLVTDPLIYVHGHRDRPSHFEWYPESVVRVPPSKSVHQNPHVRALLKQVDVLMAWETFFDWELVNYCREVGVKTALVSMYEWTPLKWPAKPDMVICPSLLDYDYFKDQFPPGRCVFLPVPVRTDLWKQRTHARQFLHNAGNVGHREHKGTRQLLEAARLLTKPVKLTVRAQDTAAFRSIVADVFGQQLVESIRWSRAGNGYKTINPRESSHEPTDDAPRLGIGFGELPYESLWDDFDVYVAPEKFNGLSLPLQEARAAGLLVMTTDRYPANTWLPKLIGPMVCPSCSSEDVRPSVGLSKEVRRCRACDRIFDLCEGDRKRTVLIPVSRYERACIGSSYYEFDEAIMTPEDIAATIDSWHGKEIASYSLSGKEWAEQNSWPALLPKWLSALEGLACPR